MNSKKWIIIWISLFALMGLLPYLLTYIYLESNYENNSYSDIVKRQLKNDSLYGDALNQNFFTYKLELIKNKKPKIIALGSSRVMQFRKESFNASFINAGGSMQNLNEGYKFLENMYQFHKPEYIILGLDFWWFNDNYPEGVHFPQHENNGKTLTYNKLYKTILWLVNGKIKILLPNKEKIENRYTNYDNLGFNAIFTSTGFRSDGSRLYGDHIFGIERSPDENFSDTFARIRDGNRRFEYGNELPKNRVETLYKIIKLIEENDTKIILIIPPIANDVYRKMKNYQYGFVDKFRELINSLNEENYDYHNPSVISKDDCEFVDGFHGGDVFFNRILKNMHDNNSSISKYIKTDNVNNSINSYQGNTLTINSENIFKNQEVDFLKLGCKKLQKQQVLQ
jgi:hypothetical protein